MYYNISNKGQEVRKMQKFIRIDIKGRWKDKKHISSSTAGAVHEGASCYRIDDDVVHGVENLWSYWTTYASTHYNPSDFKDKQITIFEGEKVEDGPDGEDIAVSKRTIKEIDAVPFMNKLSELIDQHEFEEISDDEYKKELEKLVQG